MVEIIVDARGLRCPLPLLKLKQALSKAAHNDHIRLLATDSGSWRDVPAYLEMSSHQLIDAFSSDQEFSFLIRKGAAS